METTFSLRSATVEDAAIVAHHRRQMFHDMGHHDPAQLDVMAERFTEWVRVRLADGCYRGWFAMTADQQVAAGAGVWLMDWPPHVVSQSAVRANILNVYTEPGFRRRGLARMLMQNVLDWCKANAIDAIILHASPDGRPLYEAMGFEATNEMRLKRR